MMAGFEVFGMTDDQPATQKMVDVEMKSPSDSNAVAGLTFERPFFSDIDFFRSEDLMKSQELLPACHGVQCHHVCWYGPYGRAH